jgi:hypothetical protein
MQTPDQLRELFRRLKKNEANVKRQKTGHGEKDHADSKSL